jgi:uncharacterized membrane protein
MKKMFLTGLAILLPIAITFLIIAWIFDLITTPFIGLTKNLIVTYGFNLEKTHQLAFTFLSRFLALLFLIFIILILGFLGQRFIFAPLLRSLEKLLDKIPIVKIIYRTINEVTKNALKDGKKSLFQGTAIVPFPQASTRAVGLIAGSTPQAITKREKKLQAVFVPTSPHPISGFLVMYSKDEVQPIDMNTEELLKFLLSCGTTTGQEKKAPNE